jgi:hypothetical protein
MHKTITFIFIALLLLSKASISQPDTAFLHKQYQKRLHLERQTGLVLGGWGVANILTGAIGASQTTGSTKYFHQMNFGWGIINTGLAVLMRGSAKRKLKLQPSTSTVWKEQRRVENILMLNTGLDVAYMAIGWGLKERGQNKSSDNPDRLKGFGNSLMLQGGFLFAFDIIQYILHRRQGKAMENWTDQLTIQSSGNGLSVALNIR